MRELASRDQPVGMRARDTEQPRRLRDTQHQHPTCLVHHNLRLASSTRRISAPAEPNAPKNLARTQRNRETSRTSSAWSCRVRAGAADRGAVLVWGAAPDMHAATSRSRVRYHRPLNKSLHTKSAQQDCTDRESRTATPTRYPHRAPSARTRDHRLPTRRRRGKAGLISRRGAPSSAFCAVRVLAEASQRQLWRSVRRRSTTAGWPWCGCPDVHEDRDHGCERGVHQR